MQTEPEADPDRPGKVKSTQKAIDALAALVPAEALAIHAIVIEVTTQSMNGSDDMDVTTITEPGVLRGSFWALLVAALVAYVAPRIIGGKWKGLDFVRMLIGPAAFVLWMILQEPSAAQVVDPITEWSAALKVVVVVFGALGLGLLSGLLAYKADETPT